MPSVASSAFAAARLERESQFSEDNKIDPDCWLDIGPSPTLSKAKGRAERAAVWFLQLRRKDRLEGRALMLTQKVRTGVDAVKAAYDDGMMFETIRLGRALKRPAHKLRDTMQALQPNAQLPLRGSQFRNSAMAPNTPDANHADEVRAWVNALDGWLETRQEL